MTNLIPPETQEEFDFVKERHLGQAAETYEALLTQSSTDDAAWGAVHMAQMNVSRGILRWIRSHDETFIATFVDRMQAFSLSRYTWAVFRVQVWDAMDASAWLRRWDCWMPSSDLWRAAMYVVFFALTHTHLPHND